MNDDKILDVLEREDVHLADRWLRCLAWCIDLLLISIIFALIHIDTISQIKDLHGNMDYKFLREIVMSYLWQVQILKIGYDTFFVWRCGASIGKIVCRIRVVSVDLLDKPSFSFALLRACGKYIGESLLFITYVFGFGDAFVRTLHDRLARTLVLSY